MEQHAKKTLLHDWHVAHGANMAIFGGYDMPLWYPTGVRTEHLAVLTRAGLFDTSHMAVVTLCGPDAFNLLQHCFTKDLSACIGPKRAPLSPGRCFYGAFLSEGGETIDDAIVYYIKKDTYMVVVNAGMGAAIAAHLAAYRGDGAVDIIDLTDKAGKLDLQGPDAARILKTILSDPVKALNGMGYFSVPRYLMWVTLVELRSLPC